MIATSLFPVSLFRCQSDLRLSTPVHDYARLVFSRCYPLLVSARANESGRHEVSESAHRGSSSKWRDMHDERVY